MDTHSDVDVVHANRSNQHVNTEHRSNDQRDRQHERRQQVKQRFVHLLEDEDLGTNLPPSKLPGTKDVSHVVVDSIHEEEVPAIEALAENCHLAEAAAAAAGEEDRSGRFGFHEDRAAHCHTASELAGGVAKEPIFGD